MKDYLVLINKKRHISSQSTIKEFKKKFLINKIGFAGTLDPEAEGLLIVGVNKGTKLLNHLENANKSYQVTMQFGYQTSTLDLDGEIVIKDQLIPSNVEKVKEIVSSFSGEQMQEPPIFSAIKQNGVRSYDRARQGEKFTLPLRKITIFEIKNIQYNPNNGQLTFLANVSKGTYIRSLVRDIANKLNSVATMTKLVRTKVDNYLIENSQTVEELTLETLKKYQIGFEQVYKITTKVELESLSEYEQKLILNGNQFTTKQTFETSKIGIYQKNVLIAIYEKAVDKEWKCKIFLK